MSVSLSDWTQRVLITFYRSQTSPICRVRDWKRRYSIPYGDIDPAQSRKHARPEYACGIESGNERDALCCVKSINDRSIWYFCLWVAGCLLFFPLFFSAALAMYLNTVIVGRANCPSLRSTTGAVLRHSVCSLSYLESHPREKSTDNLCEWRTHHSHFIPSYFHPRRILHLYSGREVLIDTTPKEIDADFPVAFHEGWNFSLQRLKFVFAFTTSRFSASLDVYVNGPSPQENWRLHPCNVGRFSIWNVFSRELCRIPCRNAARRWIGCLLRLPSSRSREARSGIF